MSYARVVDGKPEKVAGMPSVADSRQIKHNDTNVHDAIDKNSNDITEIKNDLVTTTGVGRNGIYRGKDLGAITSSNIEQFIIDHKVSSGEFKDLCVGDRITIQDGTYNAIWIIAGFDTEYNKGDTAMSNHHISLIPISPLFNAQMNSSNTTTGGYAGSAMHTSTLPTVANNLKRAVGTHLLNRRVLLSNSTSPGASMAGAGYSGYSSSWTWADAYCTLLTEVQIYGSTVFSSSFFDVGEGYEKLPIFNFAHHCSFYRSSFWLRTVASSTDFANVSDGGVASGGAADGASGVHPLIILG